MATLAAIKRQIAKLEAEVVRKTKVEMAGAIAKVHDLMKTYGLTVEHLSGTVSGNMATKSATKKSAVRKTKGKRAGAGIAKYRDPKTGVTWTGFGRAPGWIASAKSRDAFLIDAPDGKADAPAESSAVTTVKRAAKKVGAKAVSAAKPGKAAKKTRAQKAVAPASVALEASTATAKKAAPKKASAKKVGSKKVPAKKAPTKAAAIKKASTKSAPAEADSMPMAVAA